MSMANWPMSMANVRGQRPMAIDHGHGQLPWPMDIAGAMVAITRARPLSLFSDSERMIGKVKMRINAMNRGGKEKPQDHCKTKAERRIFQRPCGMQADGHMWRRKVQGIGRYIVRRYNVPPPARRQEDRRICCALGKSLNVFIMNFK